MMTNLARAVSILVSLAAAAPLWAQGGPPPDPRGAGMTGAERQFGPPAPPAFLKDVFPPKLVMEHQQEIGLTSAQVEAIKQAMTQAQQQLVDIEWRLDAESEGLGKLLAADHVDEPTVLAKLDQVTALEQQMKKVNFTLLVRIKNHLDPEQQKKLRALQPLFPLHRPQGPEPPRP